MVVADLSRLPASRIALRRLVEGAWRHSIQVPAGGPPGERVAGRETPILEAMMVKFFGLLVISAFALIAPRRELRLSWGPSSGPRSQEAEAVRRLRRRGHSEEVGS